MIFLLITYVIPMTLMTVCYTIMGKELWGSKAIGEKTQRQMDAIRSKKKIVKMFILVVLIFGLCWLPYHGYFIYVYFDTSIIYHRYTQHVYLGFYWFAMSNAMVNPVIYYWMNARFKQYYRSVMCGWKTCTNCHFERSDSYSLRNTPSNSKSGEFRGNDSTMRHYRQSTRRERRCENGDAVQHSLLRPISKEYCAGKVQLTNNCNTNGRPSGRSWRERKPITTDL
ncbi:unnamed protein product [Acanthoscelides obtectus]|nr:unnamed protein product [Acanthoscelides obtectus]CAK1649270.1 Tachykinin-like peptides receptor 86C [Acanthoscelides obtectus]